ncbi:MAG: hypothetical protein HOO91_03835 [Bacteroidales bacterium]|nr:hypothetical protein [Bacteroidales bacterium]
MKQILFCTIWIFIVFSSCNNYINNNTSTSGIEISELIKQANDFYQKSNYEKAVMLYDRIIAIDTTIGEVYYNRGYCNSQIDEYKKSVDDYLMAIKHGYKTKDAIFNLGFAYSLLENDTLALKYFLKTLELEPKQPDATLRVIEIKLKFAMIELYMKMGYSHEEACRKVKSDGH